MSYGRSVKCSLSIQVLQNNFLVLEDMSKQSDPEQHTGLLRSVETTFYLLNN